MRVHHDNVQFHCDFTVIIQNYFGAHYTLQYIMPSII